jgi:sn-glycerol 3-phosphate transport system substrate-binding protein
MKTRILLPMILVLTLVLSACGGGGGTTAASSGGGSVDKNGHVTLEFWYSLSGDSGKAVEYLVDQFNKSQANVTVVPTFQGDYATTQAKLYSAIAGGTLPNVAQVGGAALLGTSGAILPISQFLSGDNGMDISNIYQAFLDYNTAGGTLWSMPFNNSVPVMYYNKDLFTAAGLDPENPPKTFTDLVADAQKLTVTPSGSSTPTQWGFNTRDDNQWYLSTLILENGGKIVSDDETQVLYNSPEAVAMLSLWSDLVNKYKVMPPNQHSEAQSDFLAGKLGIFLSSSASIGSIVQSAPFKVGVAMIPAVGDLGQKLPVGGGSLVIFTNSNQAIVDASWTFTKYMVSHDSMVYLATHTGYLPIYKDAQQWPEITSYLAQHPENSAAIQSLSYVVVIPEFSALGDSDSALRTAMQQVELGAAAPQAAMDQAKATVDNSISEMQPTP